MTLTAAKNLKDTWISIFRRKGGDGDNTRLFDNLAPSQRNMLFAEFRLEESELPVVGSVQNSRKWFILTTERLAWSIEGKRREVAVNAIRDAKADLKQLQRSDNGKFEIRQPGSSHRAVLNLAGAGKLALDRPSALSATTRPSSSTPEAMS